MTESYALHQCRPRIDRSSIRALFLWEVADGLPSSVRCNCVLLLGLLNSIPGGVMITMYLYADSPFLTPFHRFRTQALIPLSCFR
jgi:hypothetical protein